MLAFEAGALVGVGSGVFVGPVRSRGEPVVPGPLQVILANKTQHVHKCLS